jgi:hypothetical protein
LPAPLTMTDSPLSVSFRLPKWMGEELLDWAENFDEDNAARHYGPGTYAQQLAEAIIDGLTLTRRNAMLRLPERQEELEGLIQFALRERLAQRRIWNLRPPGNSTRTSKWRRLETAARRSLTLTKMTPLQRLAVEGESQPERLMFV